MTSVRVGSRRNEYLEAALEEKPVPNGGRAAGRVRENNAIRTCAPPPCPQSSPAPAFPRGGRRGAERQQQMRAQITSDSHTKI